MSIMQTPEEYQAALKLNPADAPPYQAPPPFLSAFQNIPAGTLSSLGQQNTGVAGGMQPPPMTGANGQPLGPGPLLGQPMPGTSVDPNAPHYGDPLPGGGYVGGLYDQSKAGPVSGAPSPYPSGPWNDFPGPMPQSPQGQEWGQVGSLGSLGGQNTGITGGGGLGAVWQAGLGGSPNLLQQLFGQGGQGWRTGLGGGNSVMHPETGQIMSIGDALKQAGSGVTGGIKGAF